MKIGICGLGQRTAYVAKVFCDYDPSIEIVCFTDPNPVGLPYLLEQQLAAGEQYNNLEEMLDNSQLDLLLVGSPNHLHLDHIRTGLERGLKIFAEKPVVVSEEQTHELLKLLKEYGEDQVMVGLVLRYSPLYRSLIRERDSGALGAISSIEASEHISPSHGSFFMRDWRRYTKFSGGFMLEKCCHDLDLYQGFVDARPRRVASFGSRSTFVPQNVATEIEEIHHGMEAGWKGSDKVFLTDADIIDNQTAIIEYANGTNLCFHTNLNVADKFRHFCAVGVNATAEGDFERNFFRVHSAASGELTVDESYGNTDAIGHYGAEELMIEDIMNHIVDGAPLPVSVLDALEAGLTALKIDEARTTGTVLDLTETWQRFDSFGLLSRQRESAIAAV